jgi:predicted nucleic acid-binding protein
VPSVSLRPLCKISLFHFAIVAAELRANHKLPYTDCFAAALAVHRKASLATSDKDFASVEKKLDILWTTAQ